MRITSLSLSLVVALFGLTAQAAQEFPSDNKQAEAKVEVPDEILEGRLPEHKTVFSAKNLILPEGFVIETYVSQVPNARQMALTDKGVLIVGSREEGKVYAIRDSDDDQRHDAVQVMASGLSLPSGVAVYKDDLYVAALDKILVFKNIDEQLDKPFKPKYDVFYDKLPSDRHHGWKYLKVSDDGKLIIPIGAPCNVCDKGEQYSQIIALDLETKQTQVVAKGVRNSVGFAFEPKSLLHKQGALWFTDNGRDMMGDDIPSDELNRVDTWGQDFGFPYVHQGDVLDPEFGKGKAAQNYTPPQLKLGAHVAALGMDFYTEKEFPKEYRNGIFVALHGSWNRSEKVGYKVVFIPFEAGSKDKPSQVGEMQDFVSGWLEKDPKQGELVFGRPADVMTLEDGSLLISDDFKGVIYRVFYKG